MKKGWEKIFEGRESPEARSRILRSLGPKIEARAKEKESALGLGWLWKPMGGLALAGGVAALVILGGKSSPRENQAAFLEAEMNPELVMRAEMLLDLRVLEQWKPQSSLKKSKKWPKERT